MKNLNRHEIAYVFWGRFALRKWSWESGMIIKSNMFVGRVATGVQGGAREKENEREREDRRSGWWVGEVGAPKVFRSGFSVAKWV